MPDRTRDYICSVRMEPELQTRYLTAIRAENPRDTVSAAVRRHMEQVASKYEKHQAALYGRAA